MYFSKATIHWRRLRESSIGHLDHTRFQETYLCDFTTMSVHERDRQYGNRQYPSGSYLGVSTTQDLRGDQGDDDGYAFTRLASNELFLDAGRFQNFDPHCYENRVVVVVDVLDRLGDLIDKDSLGPYIEWFHEHTRGTDDRWNLSIDFNRAPSVLGLNVFFTFFTTNAELAVLMRLEQTC